MSAPWPFSVGFPLVIRRSPQHNSIAICGANRGEGWPILCQVPIDTFHEKDAASIVAACTAYLDREKEQEKIKALSAALELIARECEKNNIGEIGSICPQKIARAALATP